MEYLSSIHPGAYVIVAAVLGGVVTGLFLLLNTSFNNYLQNKIAKNSDKLTPERKKSLEGTWEGEGYQTTENGDKYNTIVTFQVSTKNNKLKGDMLYEYNFNETKKSHMIFEGGFYYQRFIKLEYISTKEGAIQFGTCIFELDSGATRLRGRFLGFGKTTEALVYGEMNLTKIS